jgi:hypothetical protein
MAESSDPIPSLLSNPLGSFKVEDLVVEAARDLIKEEIKRHIRKRLDEDPALREKIREAIAELMEAKVREAYAMVKIGKCGVDLAIALVPAELRKQIDQDIAEALESQVSQMVSKID